MKYPNKLEILLEIIKSKKEENNSMTKHYNRTKMNYNIIKIRRKI